MDFTETSCISQKQVTFTPRLLTADLKGGIGSIYEQSILYDTEPKNISNLNDQIWDGEKLEITNTVIPNPETPSTETSNEPDEAKDSTSTNNENDTKSWADYLLPVFHPRSLTVIKEYSHNCTNRPFDLFTYGRNLWTTDEFCDNFSDKIRSYVEECDLMQGFQVLCHYISCLGRKVVYMYLFSNLD